MWRHRMDIAISLPTFEAEALRQIAAGALPGVAGMVANEHDVLYRGAFGVGDIDTGRPLRVDDVFFIASMTKAITSLACAQLIEQARVGLEDDAAALVPSMVAKVLTGFDANGQPILRDPRRKVTVRHLL